MIMAVGHWLALLALTTGTLLAGCQSSGAAGYVDPTATPRPQPAAPAPATVTPQPTPTPAPSAPTPVIAMNEGGSTADVAFGHGPDYSWVAGELYYNELEGGFWGIRYIADPAAAAADPHGGRFVLGRDPRLQGFSAGDRVRLRGRISSGQASIFMAGTIYQFDEIRRQ
ncbi:MAG: hypothetical protein HYY05_08030 [Chloroflexi bacterium]|nr:hypothetical protein [Chloroflexota bacterium]